MLTIYMFYSYAEFQTKSIYHTISIYCDIARSPGFWEWCAIWTKRDGDENTNVKFKV